MKRGLQLQVAMTSVEDHRMADEGWDSFERLSRGNGGSPKAPYSAASAILLSFGKINYYSVFPVAGVGFTRSLCVATK